MIAHLDRTSFRAVVWSNDTGPLVSRWQRGGAKVLVRPLHLFEALNDHFISGAIERDPALWRRCVLAGLNLARAIKALPTEMATCDACSSRSASVSSISTPSFR